ncbi:MAG TPA: hypothetical protein VET65_10035 [Candidatus Limnocylindrales bacterium]|nr:hypothetical protein [Candidatus Limnocylindrales bacterium]
MAKLEREPLRRPQHGQEMVQALEVALERRLELEQDRAEMIAQAARRLDHAIDRLLLHRHPLDVADVAAALDREQKPGRRLACPFFEPLARRLPVERVVQLHGVELAGVEGEMLTHRQLRWIEAPAPVRIRPPRGPHPNVRGHGAILGPLILLTWSRPSC